jgi:hypothetical protein
MVNLSPTSTGSATAIAEVPLGNVHARHLTGRTACMCVCMYACVHILWPHTYSPQEILTKNESRISLVMRKVVQLVWSHIPRV